MGRSFNGRMTGRLLVDTGSIPVRPGTFMEQ